MAQKLKAFMTASQLTVRTEKIPLFGFGYTKGILFDGPNAGERIYMRKENFRAMEDTERVATIVKEMDNGRLKRVEGGKEATFTKGGSYHSRRFGKGIKGKFTITILPSAEPLVGAD